MIYTFASEEASGISSLGLNVKAFIFQLITFVIIIWILNKFALKKIFTTIEQRRVEVEESLKNAELAKEALAKADTKADEIVEEARVKADALASDAQAEAAETVKAAEVKASQKAERILAESREQLTQDVAKATVEMKKEAAKLVSVAAGAVLDEKLTSAKDEQLIARSLDEASR